jgi:hypothetical protein
MECSLKTKSMALRWMMYAIKFDPERDISDLLSEGFKNYLGCPECVIPEFQAVSLGNIHEPGYKEKVKALEKVYKRIERQKPVEERIQPKFEYETEDLKNESDMSKYHTNGHELDDLDKLYIMRHAATRAMAHNIPLCRVIEEEVGSGSLRCIGRGEPHIGDMIPEMRAEMRKGKDWEQPWFSEGEVGKKERVLFALRVIGRIVSNMKEKRPTPEDIRDRSVTPDECYMPSVRVVEQEKAEFFESEINSLKEAGYEIVETNMSHSLRKSAKDPEREDYTFYQAILEKKDKQ